MDRSVLKQHLAQVNRHVAEGKRHVARQRQIIAELERNGHDPAQAKKLLETFEELQAMHLAERNRLRKTLLAFPEVSKLKRI